MILDHELLTNLSHPRAKPEVTIVIMNARGVELLKNCLDSVIKTDFKPFKVIVVDSQTSSISHFLQNYPDVSFAHFEKDIGPAESHNVGVALTHSSSKYVAFLDNDVVVKQGWLKPLVELLEKDESVGVVGSLSIKMSGGLDLSGGFLDVSGRTHWPDIKDVEKVIDVFEPRGNAFLVRKDLFTDIGGFDRNYFLYYDVADFCLRVHSVGSRCVVLPTSVVYHEVSATAKKTQGLLLDRPTYYLTRNKIRFVIKNFPSKVLPMSIILIAWQSFLSLSIAIVRRNIKVVFSMFRAFIDVAIHMKEILEARRLNRFRLTTKAFHTICSLSKVKG